MKMQSNSYSPAAGRVTQLLVSPDQHIEFNELLVTITP